MNNDQLNPSESESGSNRPRPEDSAPKPVQPNNPSFDDDDALELSSPTGAAAYQISDPDERPKPKPVAKNLSKSDPFTPSGKETENSDKSETSQVKRLTPDQVQNINQRLGSNSESATNPSPKKSKVKHQKNSQAFAKPVEAVHSSTESTPSKSNPALPISGIAHFTGQSVTFESELNLHQDELITFRQKNYQLKTATPNHGPIVYAFAAAALLTLGYFTHGLFDGNSGSMGSMAGVALGETGTPYAEGAVVRIEKLGISTVTDSRGMFRFDDLPEGEHTLEFNLPGNLGGKLDASVQAGSVTLLTLDNAVDLTRTAPVAKHTQKRIKPAKKTPSKPANSPTNASRSRGSLAVTANIKGATVYIDGQKLGDVNHTFRKMNTGSRTLRITKPGFETYEKTIRISSDKLSKVHAELVALETDTSPKEPKPLQAYEHYDIAVASVDAGDFKKAEASLTDALALDPGMGDAYFLRGEIRAEGQPALLDYVRAAEIYSSQQRDGDTRLALEKALGASTDNKVAYKVRGDFHVQRGDYDQGVIDYQYALEQDSKYFDAQKALGVAYFKTGSHRKAQKALLRARDYDKQDATLYHYLMLNSLAKNDIGGVNRYYVEFNEIAKSPDIKRFDSAPELSAIRRIVKR